MRYPSHQIGISTWADATAGGRSRPLAFSIPASPPFLAARTGISSKPERNFPSSTCGMLPFKQKLRPACGKTAGDSGTIPTSLAGFGRIHCPGTLPPPAFPSKRTGSVLSANFPPKPLGNDNTSIFYCAATRGISGPSIASMGPTAEAAPNS